MPALHAALLRDLGCFPKTVRITDDHGSAREDLQQIRETGWAQAEGERVPDAFGLAAPFFADDAVAGSLTFTIPRFRAEKLDVETLATMLTDAARQVTVLLSV
jgi:DNA-binding IclR family transcriptional regulator